jgi:Putative Ig domain
MGRFGRKLLPAFVIALLGFALPALASNVTVNGNVNFSSLDGSVDDQDHVVNGIFTVNGDLTVNGTINCNDGVAFPISPCSMQFNVSGDMTVNAGGALYAEDRIALGSPASITINTGGRLTLAARAGATPGAIVSTAALAASIANGGAVTVNAGSITMGESATIDASSFQGIAGNISLTSSGQISLDGNVLSGPSRTFTGSLTGELLSGVVPAQKGGQIAITSTSFAVPALLVGTHASVISQGQNPGAGPVTLNACGIEIRGQLAALARLATNTQVSVRSGKDLLIDARDLGVTGSTLGRVARLRSDTTLLGTGTSRFVDLFAHGSVTVLGPAAASSTRYSISSIGGTADPSTRGGNVRVIALEGTVTLAGRVADASQDFIGGQGGHIDIASKGDADLTTALLRAVGNFAVPSPGRKGGAITVRSHSGNVIWTNGTGDVRPIGSTSGIPPADQGTIDLSACGTIDTTGTTFPANGVPTGVFPTTHTGVCSPAAPSLPAGVPALPTCCNTIIVTNPAVSTGTAGTPFSQTFTQTGAIGTATFTIATGTLPSGLTLATNGVLSGTPAVIGTFPITVKVTDSFGCTGVGSTYNLQIVCPTITVTNPAVNSGVAGSPFSQTFTRSGGVGTTTFSLASGTLPAGLTLASNGVLSGTPTQTGTFPITVKATDANGCTGTGPTYTLTLACQTITVTNPAVSSGVAGTPFSQTFTQSGGIGATTFSLASGTLPAGLTLAANGVLSGTPTQTGTFAIRVKATDANGCTGTGAIYNLTIACQTITVTNPAGNSGVAGSPFSQTFTQSGGIGTTTFSLASGALPAGLTLAANGVLSGTPTQTGTFAITVKATDANGCNGTGATYTLTIACQTITVTNPAVSTGVAGSPFSQTFTQSGGIGTLAFSLASGTLPSGLTLAANGVLSGTPMVTGTFPITVKVTDANGCTGTGPTYNLVINCQTITVTAPPVSSAVAGAPFSQTFTQSGAIGTATFSLVSGTLPSGLALATNGGLSGTPLQTGTFSITVKVTDANGCTGTTGYTLTIVCQTINVTNPAVNSGVAGAPFSQTFTQSGAIGTATFSLASGTLPAGLSLSASGVLSGTPTQTGSFPITVAVTDSNGCSGVGPTYTLTVACQTITVTNPAVSIGIAGQAFSQSFTQSGAIGTATFTLATGTLPSGLTLAADGTLSGIPLQTGTFPVTVTVTDANGCTGTSATYNLTINCQPITVTHPANMTGTVGVAFSEQYTQSGGIGTVTFATSSTLPAGMTLAADGTLSGTPTQSGSFPITVTATDSNGCTGSDTFTLTIGCQTITVTNPGVSTGTVGTPFSQTFTQSGANGTATFSLASGTLPTGLSLSPSGILSGTPAQTGSFPITVKVTDSNGCTGTGATYTLVISCQTITVTNPATTTGTVGTPFSQTFTQSGGIGTVTFSTSSTLPAGLSLSGSGVLSGTPTQTGSFPITVTATDSNGCTGTGATYTLVISCQIITVTNPATTTGTVDAPFSATFTQSGAIGTATFTLASGSLPAGLTLSASGVLSGTPQVPGTFPITVTVTDSNGCTGTSPTYTLVVACQTITVTNPSSTTGTFGVPLSGSFTFTQSGVGTHTPAVFSINSGSLPSGVTLSSSGVLSGTPAQTGVFSITVKVTDANGCTGIGSTYTLTIAPNLTTKSYVDVGNTQLDGGLPPPATPAVISVAVSNGDASDAPITYAVTVPPFNGTLTTFNPNGTFLYTPNVGNTAADSFTYTGTSNGIAVTRSATITFTGRVWYVDNATLSATNDGRSNTPFKTLTAVGAAPTASGDFIYVSKGSGPTTGSYTMLPSQQLIGAGATLSVGGVLTVPGAAANTPTLSGTLALATNVTVAGIDMNTGGGNAITGTSVSGINVTVRNLTTTTGTPVSITSGTGTMTVTQLNAGTAAAGPASAITLTNFGGAFTVLGDGGSASNGSGGTIQRTTSHAVSLTGITGAGVSLGYLNISNSGANGINATTVSNLTVNHCNISDTAGSTLVDDGVGIRNASGTVAITNSAITGSRHQGVTIDNLNTNMAGLTMTSTTVSGTVGGDGMLVEMRGTSVLTSGTVGGATAAAGCTFSNNTSTGLQVVGADTANFLSLTVQNNAASGNNAGMDFDLSQAASMNIFVASNTFNNHQSDPLNVFSGSANTGGTMTAKLQGNSIGTAGVFNSGSFFGNGIRVALNGGTHGVITIDGNVVREVPNARGIDVEAQGFASANSVNVKITNNQVVRPTGASGDIGCGPGVPCPGGSIVVISDKNNVASESICSVITGNTAYDPTSWPAGSESAFYLARRSLQTLNLEGNTSLSPAQNILNNNTVTNLTNPGFGDFTDESGNVVVVAPGSCGTFP